MVDTYDESKDDTLRTMLGDFYNRKMLPLIIIVWIDAIIVIWLAICSAMKFFEMDDTKSQIMYAAIFICCVQFMVLIKIFAWQMITKNNIKRAIKRLDIRIAELSQVIKDK